MESPESIDRQPRHKRPRRTSGAEAFASRKRAAKACHFCRLRKTKCDNKRPVCGFCRTNAARCVYDDDDEGGGGLGDGEQKEVLEKLGELTRTVESLASSGKCRCSQIPLQGSGTGLDGSNGLQRCESVLRWPIFQAFLTKQERGIQSFVLDSGSSEESSYAEGSAIGQSSRRALIEEEVVPLVNKFFDYINPRNPILDAGTVKLMAARIAEHGFGWDCESCLILIICALTYSTTKWTFGTDGLSQPQSISTGHQTDLNAANAYFIAAKKRIGLLRDVLIDVQCLFLAHIYEKCALRAVEAAYYIQQASIRLQVHISRSNAFNNVDGLMDRLYWSIIRAESELLPELGLQRSGLQHLGPTTSFPQPPDSSIMMSPSPPTGFSVPGDGAEQSGWYFYLAEISIRRTLPEMITLMYEATPRSWLEDIDKFLPRHAECHRQIVEMQNHLPIGLHSNDVEMPPNELAFFLRSRFLECQLLILQPFLYYVVHNTTSSANAAAVQLAQDSLFYCAQSIRNAAMLNRHGGTWFALRGTFTAGMMLLAAVLDSEHLKMLEDWEKLAQSALETLRLWSSGVSDVQAMQRVLEKVYLCTKAASQAKTASI